MDLFFNELSIEPLTQDKTEAFLRVDQLLATFKCANIFGFNIIRFQERLESIKLSKDYSLEEFCNDPKNRTKATLLRGVFRYPFLHNNSEEENAYIENTFLLKKDGDFIEPYGLTSAFLCSSLAIGFNSEQFWTDYKFTLLIKGAIDSEGTVFCVSNNCHWENPELTSYLENSSPVSLLETQLLPKDKPIALRDDHGKDILLKFSKQLCNSPYIISIINSLPYNRFETEFIRKIYPNGNIEIVLINTDLGFGLVVKTTGKNRRETQAIAKVLERKYNP